MKKNLTLPKEVSEWMNKFNLHPSDSWTEAGVIACPHVDSMNFTLQNRAEAISLLNRLYGLTLNDSFLSIKGKGIYHQSLEDIEQCRLKVDKLKSILPEEFNLEKSLFYICGISVPKRDLLYIEYPFVDRELQESYTRQDYRPNVFSGVEFIPLSEENFA